MSKNNAPSVYAEISRIYHDPAASSLVPPLAKIDFLFDNGSMAPAFLPPDQLTTSGLKKAVPRLRGLPDIRPLVCELNTRISWMVLFPILKLSLVCCCPVRGCSVCRTVIPCMCWAIS